MGAVTEDAFCLKWNDFHTSLTSSFAELREESDLLDATVVCDGTPMRAHKLVLSACSGVFRQLFRSSSSALGFAQGYTFLKLQFSFLSFKLDDGKRGIRIQSLVYIFFLCFISSFFKL